MQTWHLWSLSDSVVSRNHPRLAVHASYLPGDGFIIKSIRKTDNHMYYLDLVDGFYTRRPSKG